MQIPLELKQDSPTTLQQQLCDQLRDAILMGKLAAGQRIPASRELSQQLTVSRNTVTLAYDRLIAEGYLESRRGVGMFVNLELPEAALHSRRDVINRSEPIRHLPDNKFTSNFDGRRPVLNRPESRTWSCDFRIGRPDPDAFPIKVWRRLANRVLSRNRPELTQYGDPAGLMPLRQAIARHVASSRGIVADPEQVIVVAGTQEAMNLASRVFLGKGSRVAVESPTYQNAAYCFESYGAELVPIPVDESGIVVEHLPKKAPHMIYVTPSHSFPRGVTMSLQRRLQLLEYASRTGSYILEDDYDGDFRFHGSPLTALQGLDVSERVLYTTTFSKSIGPGIRLAYVISPPHLLEKLVTAKALLNNGHPCLEQMILAEFINSGQFEKHLRRIRVRYMARRDCLVRLLNEYFGPCKLNGQYCGLHLAWRLDPKLPTATELQQIAAEIGVRVYPVAAGSGYIFDDSENLDRILLLGYPSVSEDKMTHAIADLAAAVDRYMQRGKRKSI